MENAHLRMGKLTFVRQTRDTITSISLHLNRVVAERPDNRHAAALHLVSVFGGDSEIAALTAAVHEGLHFQIALGMQDLIGTLGEKPVLYRASLQLAGRKRPVRHLVALSKEFFETTLGANSGARRSVLYDGSAEFVLQRLAVRFGLPVLPDWAEWFYYELHRRQMVEELVGLNCFPTVVKGTKLRMLRILSQGLRRREIQIPADVTTAGTPTAEA